jgi:DNA-directed RNA polymerase subunit N (RpoN/RPB10)
MFPIRCYTCNALLAHKHPAYRDATTRRGVHPRQALAELEVARMCCRRMFLGHVDLLEDQLRHPNVDRVLDEGGTVLRRHAEGERTVACN